MKVTKTLVTIIGLFIVFVFALIIAAFKYYIDSHNIDSCMYRYKDYEYCKQRVGSEE